jgi:hypothetical protein
MVAKKRNTSPPDRKDVTERFSRSDLELVLDTFPEELEWLIKRAQTSELKLSDQQTEVLVRFIKSLGARSDSECCLEIPEELSKKCGATAERLYCRIQEEFADYLVQQLQLDAGQTLDHLELEERLKQRDTWYRNL